MGFPRAGLRDFSLGFPATIGGSGFLGSVSGLADRSRGARGFLIPGRAGLEFSPVGSLVRGGVRRSRVWFSAAARVSRKPGPDLGFADCRIWSSAIPSPAAVSPVDSVVC